MRRGRPAHPRLLPLLVASSCLLPLGCATAARSALDPAVSAAVDTLLALPHGLAMIGPEERLRLARIEAAPDEAARRLRELFDPEALSGPDSVLRFERGITLAARSSSPRMIRLLGDWYEAVDRQSTSEAAPAATRLRTVLLSELRTAPVPAVVDRAARALPSFDRATRAAALGYLSRCCSAHPPTVALVRGHFEDSSSPLHGHADLARFLAARP